MKKTSLRQRLASIADAVDARDLDYASGELANLIRELAPPVPTESELARVLEAMNSGNDSAASIKAATGLSTRIIYPARYVLLSRGLIIQYSNGLASPRWGAL